MTSTSHRTASGSGAVDADCVGGVVDSGGDGVVVDGRLVPAAIGCWGVTIAAVVGGWVVGVGVALGLVVVAIGLWVALWWGIAHRSERWRVVGVVVLAAVVLSAGFAVAAAWREHRVAVHPLRSVEGKSVWVVVTPSDDPKPVRAGAFGGERRWVVRARLQEFRQGAVTVRAGGAVVILAGEEWADLLPGQSVAFRARVDQPGHRDLTVAMLRAHGPPERVGLLPWWQRAAGAVRTNLAAASQRALSDESAGLLPALVVGDTARLPDQVRDEFEIAGLQHLCVVSGTNFTILLAAVLGAVRVLTLGPRAGAAVSAIALVLFVFVARPDPSVLRAGAMGAITLLAMVTGRRKQALPALCAAVIGLLAVWPELAVSAGFALSVLATAALILVAPSWADWLRARGWWRTAAEVVAVSAAAFVVTTPLVVALSGKLSLVAILANILVAPAVAPITVLGALGAALSCIWPPIAELVLRCAGPLLWWLLTVAERAAQVPSASITVPSGTLSGLVAALLIATTLILLRSKAVRHMAITAILGIAVVLIPVRIWHPGWPPAGWVLAACDVGQGDGLALSLGNGAAIVIDTGPDPRPIRTCLDRFRIHQIPLLILTHPHLDHIGGLGGALHGRAVAAIAVAPGELGPQYRATTPSASAAFDAGVAPDRSALPGGDALPGGEAVPSGGALPGGDAIDLDAQVDGPAQVAAVVAQEGIPVLELSAGNVLRFGTVELAVLSPEPGHRPPAGAAAMDQANDRSIVIVATTSAGRILLTGDVEASAQQRLLRSGFSVAADVLKVPHHGSRTTTREFLEAVRPRLALVSSGAANTFGHPHPRILTDLAELNAMVARTDRQGDVVVVGAGAGLRAVTARRRIRTH